MSLASQIKKFDALSFIEGHELAVNLCHLHASAVKLRGFLQWHS